MATDEDLLIEAARRERRSHRSGRDLLLALVLGAVCAAVGWVLVFRVRGFLQAIPFLPLGTAAFDADPRWQRQARRPASTTGTELSK